MRKLIFFSVLLVSAQIVFCAPAKRRMPSPERRAELHKQFLARKIVKEGGMVTRADSIRKHLLFMNAQTCIPAAKIQDIGDKIGKRFSIETVSSNFTGGVSFLTADNVLKNWRTGAAVFIVDTPDWPFFLVAPEAKWAMINVRALSSDGNQGKLAERFEKVMWRAFAYVGGAAHTLQGDCVMRPVETLADIDRLKASEISPEPEMRIREHLSILGIRQIIKATYSQACEQGWAPAPTNDIQKAIWDKVHAMPTAPLKIKPETKKVKE